MSKVDLTKAVLIVGGYGTVGAQIAEIFRARNPQIPLLIAGRNRLKAEKLASSLGNAEAVVMDVEKPNQISPLKDKVAAVVTAVNDPDNLILVDTIRCGIPYVDITRWTARVREGLVYAATETMTQPVIFSSSWMAGVASILAKKAAEDFKEVSNIDIDILYSLKDKAGPNSIEYVDQLGTPYDIFEDGKIKSVSPMTDPRMVDFPGGISTKTFRFDTPDQMTLPLISGAKSVSARIAYDDKSSAAFLSFLVRFGIWNIINRPRFTKLRRSLLYNPGEGGSHEIVIEVTGAGMNGRPKKSIVTMVDKKGQTHLTALGGIIQVERALALAGNTGMPSGISFPEKHENLDIALQTLKDHGVIVTS